MNLQEQITQLSNQINKLQTEKQLLEIKIQNLEEQDLEFQINNFKQEIDTNVRKINADIKMTNALRYDHESEEFIYDPGFGPAIYYSYEFGDNQSIYEVIATLKRNIHLYNLLKNFDYEFNTDAWINKHKDRPYNKIYFSGEHIYGSFYQKDDYIDTKIVAYNCWDNEGFTIQIDDTVTVQASTLMDDIDIEVVDSRHLKDDDTFDDQVREMIANVKSYVIANKNN